MKSLWFVVPAHGRLELARICLAQLRRTCDTLTDNGIEASAVVVACDENLDVARALEFGTIERDNRFLSRRYNDGLQLACDPAYNPRPADFAVPLGSDDWVDWRLFLELPAPDTVAAFQRMSFVREDGRELTVRHLNNEGGAGIRIYPRQVIARARYRPADEDRARACDTSILVNLKTGGAVDRVQHRDIDPLQIVDWKTAGHNLHAYSDIAAKHRSELERDPFDALAGRYPMDALEQMRGYYDLVAVAA